jgi:NADH-quinone oxidoreductase subunit G
MADDLMNARNPLVVSGTGCGSTAVIQAAANVAYALHKSGKKAQVSFVVPHCNSMGLAMLGGKPLAGAIEAIENGSAETVIIMESSDVTDITERILSSVKNVIAIDCLRNAATDKADFVLPTATFAESDGTFVNNEGRAQRFFRVFNPARDIQDGWRWVRDIMSAVGRVEASQWETFDNLVADITGKVPVFSDIIRTSPQADFRMSGQRIPRQSHRYSGRTAMNANTDVREHKTAQDIDSPLSFSMEGYAGQPPSSLITHFWSPGWNSVQSVTKFQNEAGGTLRGGNPGVRLIEPNPSTKAKYFL